LLALPQKVPPELFGYSSQLLAANDYSAEFDRAIYRSRAMGPSSKVRVDFLSLNEAKLRGSAPGNEFKLSGLPVQHSFLLFSL
jgi:hypothetical protein